MWFLRIAELEIIKNTRTVVQKSPLRISELIEKYDLPSVRIWYQNLSFLHQNSIPKVHLKETSSIEAVLVSKVFQNDAKKEPKMLDRNWKNRPWDTFGQIKRASWSQRHLHSVSSSSFWPHMAANWTSFSPSASCSGIIAGAILLVNHSEQPL